MQLNTNPYMTIDLPELSVRKPHQTIWNLPKIAIRQRESGKRFLNFDARMLRVRNLDSLSTLFMCKGFSKIRVASTIGVFECTVSGHIATRHDNDAVSPGECK